MKVRKPKDADYWSVPNRTAIGIGFTIFYAGLLISYVIWNWAKISKLEPSNLGDFAAGAFGPLAILWLVLGYFQQGDELQKNTEALTDQATKLAESVVEQRQQVALAKEQEARFRRQLQPRFDYSIKEETPDFSEFRQFKLRVTNVGGPCSHLRFTSSEESVTISRPPEEESSRSQDIFIQVLYPYGERLIEATITIDYVDSLGEPGYDEANLALYFDEDVPPMWLVSGGIDYRVYTAMQMRQAGMGR